MQGKVSPTLGSQQPPVFTLAAGNGTQPLAYDSLDTHSKVLSAVIRDVEDTHWPVYTLWSFQATWGAQIHQGSPSCSSPVAT